MKKRRYQVGVVFLMGVLFICLVVFTKEPPESIEKIELNVKAVYTYQEDQGVTCKIDSKGNVEIQRSVLSENNEGTLDKQTRKISPKEFTEITKIIEKNKILRLPETLLQDSEIMDGDVYTLTVYTDKKVHRITGLNPKNQKFVESFRQIFDVGVGK